MVCDIEYESALARKLLEKTLEVDARETDAYLEIPVGAPEGAYVIRNLLTASECAAIRNIVTRLHDERCARKHCQSEEARRDSQIHIPLQLDSDSTFLGQLSERIRKYLPRVPVKIADMNQLGREPNESCDVTAMCKYKVCESQPLSRFFRTYRYTVGEFSAPHYDKSMREHCKETHRLLRLTTFSVLFYVHCSEDLKGGETTFFENSPHALSNSGLTAKSSGKSGETLKVSWRHAPRTGDVLIFPHGNFSDGKLAGWPNPFHEGSVVENGEKILIRTDVQFTLRSDIALKRNAKTRRVT